MVSMDGDRDNYNNNYKSNHLLRTDVLDIA